jgi:hypothetical protein
MQNEFLVDKILNIFRQIKNDFFLVEKAMNIEKLSSFK